MAKGRIRSAIKKKIRRKPKVDSATKELPEKSKRRRLNSATTRVMRKFSNVKEAFEVIESELKLQRFKVSEFTPKIRIAVEKGHFTVKTVETPDELAEVLKLRFDVFNREFFNTKRVVGVDVDKLDLVCDHLVIRDNRTNRVVGTYRLNSSTFSNQFYSSGEFEFEKIKNMPGNILELGRAAIHKDFRTGVVIALLWRGISEYMLKTNTDILLGCASVKETEPLGIGLVTYHLEKIGALKYDLDVQPTRKYKVKTLKKVIDYIDKNPFEYNEESMEKQIPPLFASYLKMGFKAYGEPALDRDFQCIDFLIMIRLDELQGSYKRRYNDKEKSGQ